MSSFSKIEFPALVDLLFESDFEEVVQSEEAKPVTIVALYGPPAAGKGAAKDATPAGDGKGGLNKLKDPNQAHETLEMPKNTI